VKRALGLAMALMLVGAGVVAATTFPFPSQLAYHPRGNGWLVLTQLQSEDPRLVHSVGVATDREGWHELWGRIAGLADLAPYVNFERQIVAVFVEGTNSCTTGVDFRNLVIDHADRLVHAVISQTRGCMQLDVSGLVVFVVAIARDRLPAGRFILQLGPEPVCGSCADPSDSVIVDL
jgi:hypothetical protein